MFTGIIEATALILQKDDRSITIERPAFFDDIKEGSSIAVAGVCLSITNFDQTSIGFDVVPETWARTKLGSLQETDRVNLERAMRADGRLEGHIVQGHVEGVGMVESLNKLLSEGLEAEKRSQIAMLTIRMPKELISFVVQKGSICLDGVSLTVARKDGDRCAVALIPHTLEHTTLGSLRPGDGVNVETDVLGRYVASFLANDHAHSH